MSSSKGIEIRRFSITNPSEMPAHYSETPGGHCYGVTPGGTRIQYDRLFMHRLKESPIARTPPKLPFIPGVTNIAMAGEHNNTIPHQPSNLIHVQPTIKEDTREEKSSGDLNNSKSTSSTSTTGQMDGPREEVYDDEDDEMDLELEMEH